MDFDLETSAPPAAVAPAANRSPLFDLSYRNYDGPLKPHAVRWSVIALSTVKQAMKNRGYWVLFGLCGLRYVIQGALLYFIRNAAQQAAGTDMGAQFAMSFSTYFFAGFCNLMNSFCILCMALIVGAGCIASDSRSGALLFYFSKPVSKGDYLLGKWMGVFLSLFAATLIPALAFYLFCLAGYRSDGFLKEDPWLILRIPVAAAIPAVLHASLLVGFSAWSKASRAVGAAYAGLYFATYVIGGVVLALIFSEVSPERLTLLTHTSISGVIDGLTQSALHAQQLDIPFVGRQNRSSNDADFIKGAPALWYMLPLGVGLCAAGIAAARARIRAVEVVSG